MSSTVSPAYFYVLYCISCLFLCPLLYLLPVFMSSTVSPAYFYVLYCISCLFLCPLLYLLPIFMSSTVSPAYFYVLYCISCLFLCPLLYLLPIFLHIALGMNLPNVSISLAIKMKRCGYFQLFSFFSQDEVRSQDSWVLFSSASSCSPRSRDLSWKFLQNNWTTIKDRFQAAFLLARIIDVSMGGIGNTV